MAETIVMIDPRALKVHPRNAEFFDDIEGAEFDRLVESIKDHGVLTPLRVTKDMTIISGHQRVRAAIQAECFSVPVIVDESDDDDDALMKLIETNFGRIKNDPIKQAKWIKEYEELRGVRQGSAGNPEPNNSAGVTQDDIAKELGVSRDTLQNLKKLLKLDPALQALVSDGKINATTGFKILSKLSPEEQQKLIDKLPDDVKFSASTIEKYVSEIRSQGAANAASVQEKNSELLGKIDNLRRENNELRSGNFDSDEVRVKIQALEEEKRDFYEKMMASKKEAERMRGEVDKANQARVKAEMLAKGGDDSVLALQNQIDELQGQLKTLERERNDLEYTLSEKEDEILAMKQENGNKIMRSAITPADGSEAYNERKLESLAAKIQGTIGEFQSRVNEILKEEETLNKIKPSILEALSETSEAAYNSARTLHFTILAAAAPEKNVFDDVNVEEEHVA